MTKPLVNLSLLEDKVIPDTVTDHCSVHSSGEGFVISALNPSHLVDGLASGNDIHFVSNGKWSMHDLLLSCLDIIRPATLYFSTFSITEFPARVLAQCLEQGSLEGIHMLLDYKAKARYPAVFQIMQNISSRIRLMPVHAKVMVLQGQQSSVTVTGSLNWTKNPRIEAGLISTSPAVAAFHKQWLTKALNNGNIFQP